MAGNQTAQASLRADGAIDLQLRLPPSVGGERRHLTLHGLRFAYGHDHIVAALAESRRVDGRRTGRALSYRLVRDRKGWRIFASAGVPAPDRVTTILAGAIGLDLNADHMALAVLDASGNPTGFRRIELPLRGATSGQAKAVIGDAVAAAVAMARTAGVPLVIEELDFRRRRAEIEAVDPALARTVSSFASSRIRAALRAAAFRAGVQLIEVNPAYTSVIGAVNHAARRGISVHMGAAIAVARRGMGFSEAPAGREAHVPLRRGGHVTLPLPDWNRERHVWSFWAGVRRKLRAAHAARARSARSTPPPAPRPSGATLPLPAGFRNASSHHRSGSDHDFIPHLEG